MLSSEDRAEIQARVDAATAGPWELASPRADGRNAVQKTGIDLYGKPVTEWIILDTHPEDAEFIAHAREDIPKLLAELTRIEQALEREGLAELLLTFLESPKHGGSWTYNPEAAADAIRTHLLGDNEGKTTL